MRLHFKFECGTQPTHSFRELGLYVAHGIGDDYVEFGINLWWLNLWARVGV